MDAGEIFGIILGAGGIIATAGFGVWAINDARNQVRASVRTERNLAWTKVQNELVWLFVDPTDRSHTKEIATGLAVLALLAKELNPEKKPEALKEAAENDALEMAQQLVDGGYATWKPDLDTQKVRQRLSEWDAEKSKARAAQSIANRRMGKGFNTRLRDALTAARSSLSLLLPKIINTPFLTLMIAVGTLITAGVALQTARDSHDQVQLLKRQVAFNSDETRPFLRLKPSISLGKKSRALLGIVEVGRIPAKVIAYDMLVQVGHYVVEPKGGTFNTEDVLYPNQPGLGVYQTLNQTDIAPFASGAEPIVVAACAVYGPITADDKREWMVSVAYDFDSNAKLPRGLFANEVRVPPRTEKCDATSVRSEWKSHLKLYPR